MKISLIAILFFFQVNFPLFIEEEITIAVEFLQDRKEIVEETSRSWHSPTEEVIALISPELIRYNLFRDFFETQVLELAYVNFGKEGADFSIGYFQMKPSFIEDLETYILEFPLLCSSFSDLNAYPEGSKKDKRQIRLNRLKDFRWQLIYAETFYQVVLHRFPKIKKLPPEERVRFVASAYNFGFTESKIDIEEWQCTVAFPYGKKYDGAQVAYSEIAWDFYHKIKSIF